MSHIFTGVIVGGITAIIGLLCRKYPDLLSPFSLMSEEKKENVDFKAVGKAGCTILVTAGVAGFVLNLIFCATGLADIGITASILSVMLGCIILVSVIRKYDHNEKSGGKYMITAIFLSVLSITIAALLFSWSMPDSIEAGNESLDISGEYAISIKYDSIKSVELLDRLPEIKARTNGIGMANTLKGHFILDGIGRCRLYVNLKYRPLVHIETYSSEHIIFNTDSPQGTGGLYDRIVSAAGSR